MKKSLEQLQDSKVGAKDSLHRAVSPRGTATDRKEAVSSVVGLATLRPARKEVLKMASPV